MDRHQNLYGDLSSSGAWALLRDSDFGRAFLVRRSDRLLFGTDYYDLQQQVFPQFELFERLQPPPEVVKKVAMLNAEKLLSARA
jgi:predicted TIM-barrel fold metal-dependent hydrolase